MSQPLFHRGHYNIIAKQLRINFPVASPAELDKRFREQANLHRGVILNLAISMAYRFQEDNPDFDPIKFLDACSPDPDMYPFSEFWEDQDGTAD